MLSRSIILVFIGITSVSAVLKCIKSGELCWSRNYPGVNPSPCDNQNNQCQVEQQGGMCVRTAEPLMPNAPYDLFRLDCWNQANTIQTSPGVTQTVTPGQCYEIKDSATPPKRTRVCFCNNGDYCNSAYSLSLHSALVVFFSALFLHNVL